MKWSIISFLTCIKYWKFALIFVLLVVVAYRLDVGQ